MKQMENDSFDKIRNEMKNFVYQRKWFLET